MRTIELDKDPRTEDQRIADEIRQKLRTHGVAALNLISSPGSGKTTLLEASLPMLAQRLRVAVICADNATDNDSNRLKAAGVPVYQVCTGITGCHLSAAAARKSIESLDLDDLDLVIIENVGNLVCPAEEDVGESFKVGMISAAEGEDKPLKYPLLFQTADLAIINKIDAAEALGADVDLLESNIRKVNPNIETIRLSAKTGEGVDRWVDWVVSRVGDMKG